jgi:molybdopterin-guanine dinucleotide biosynthesis protein B
MIPVVSIVGRSNRGKTTFIEKLIPELTQRGYRLATIKHDVHGFEIDHPGKDSYRHKAAGATISLISSPARLALVSDSDHDLTIDELRQRFIGGVDLILTEGYKRESFPKIEVFRPQGPDDLPLCSLDDQVVAIVTDTPVSLPLPQFPLDDAAVVADFIAARFLKPQSNPTIRLTVGGRNVPLNHFLSRFLRATLISMIGNLKWCDQLESEEIVITVSPKL